MNNELVTANAHLQSENFNRFELYMHFRYPRELVAIEALTADIAERLAVAHLSKTTIARSHVPIDVVVKAGPSRNETVVVPDLDLPVWPSILKALDSYSPSAMPTFLSYLPLCR
jgi:hypothetical protein